MSSIVTTITPLGQLTVGDEIAFSAVVTNDAGTTVNTPTLVLAVAKPDGTALSPSVTNTGAGGIYTAQLSVAQVDGAGDWTYLWTASGTIDGTQDGQFYVRAARQYVVGLDDLRTHLRISNAAQDQRLMDVLAGVTDIMEATVGPVEVREFTESHCVYGWIIKPHRRPLASVTSITPEGAGAALDSTLYRVDTGLNLIRFKTWRAGIWHDVVYEAGHDPWPANLRMAGTIICQHEWRVSNGSGARPSPDADALALIPGTGYLVPHRALELMRPHLPVLAA